MKIDVKHESISDQYISSSLEQLKKIWNESFCSNTNWSCLYCGQYLCTCRNMSTTSLYDWYQYSQPSRYHITYDKDGTTVIKYNLAGTNPKDISVNIVGSELIVSYGSEKTKDTIKFTLSGSLDLSEATSEYEYGLLTVRIPVKQPNKVEVKVKEVK